MSAQQAPPGSPAEALAKPAEQQIRIAIALNGGVSLAVWMGGCAVELDRARRANAPTGEAPRVYDALCKCFGRKLVIDIMTGASAGGINGALLSAAMVSGRKLDAGFVRSQWLDLGDLSDLLYPTSRDDPPALMDGKLFHERLQRAFEGVLGVDPDAPGYKECGTKGSTTPLIPSLDVTMTDVVGVEKTFEDSWGGKLVAREHRPRFKFREPAHFNAKALAAAARTSASFPIAFEPWPVKGDPRVLAGLPKATYGIDGGLLDNAPIKAALDLIPSKRADSRVRRYICYLNGDPVLAADEMAIDGPPSLAGVGAYTVNLPRVAPFVDQLYAIKRAVERPDFAGSIQEELLRMDIEALSTVAGGLFDAYRKRRTMESLEELLDSPGEASAMSELLGGTHGSLPWIPFSTLRELTPTDAWRWGIRPAQRILHLLLDLLRLELRRATGARRDSLLGVRDEIDLQLKTLDDAREQVLTPPHENDPASFTQEPPLRRLEKAVTAAIAQAPVALKAVQAAAEAFRTAATEYPSDQEDSLVATLFAAGDEEWLSTFFRRVLSIEVIRRAFSTEAEIESSQELRFVQLTPDAPSPIFTSGPLKLESPASARDKLAGVGLGHFAGFYRRSWRANDFMWGRLDAAARIVDLLLDKPSDELGADLKGEALKELVEKRSECLVAALLPEGPQDDSSPARARRWLLQEALDDVADESSSPEPDEWNCDLRAQVKERIEIELWAAHGGSGVRTMPFTRAVFQRAAQLEIVADELPVIRAETLADSKLGSAVEPFPPEKGERDLTAEVKAVRELYEHKQTLPGRLTDKEEVVSDLGLRTITHAAFVALSAVRAAGTPLSKFFGVVRPPLAAVAATVAQSPRQRAIAGLGFWAAAVYLTSRLVTASARVEPRSSEVWEWSTLTALVAAVGILGFAAVPILRAWRAVNPLRNYLTALGLLGTAYGFAAALAAIYGSFNLERIVFPPEATLPPTWVTLAPLAALGIVTFSRLPIPGWLSKFTKQVEAARGSRAFGLLTAATFILIGVWSGIDLWNEGFDGGPSWQWISALFAVVLSPIAAAASLSRWRRRPH